jgi:hypothetical protein
MRARPRLEAEPQWQASGLWLGLPIPTAVAMHPHIGCLPLVVLGRSLVATGGVRLANAAAFISSQLPYRLHCRSSSRSVGTFLQVYGRETVRLPAATAGGKRQLACPRRITHVAAPRAAPARPTVQRGRPGGRASERATAMPCAPASSISVSVRPHASMHLLLRGCACAGARRMPPATWPPPDCGLPTKRQRRQAAIAPAALVSLSHPSLLPSCCFCARQTASAAACWRGTVRQIS